MNQVDTLNEDKPYVPVAPSRKVDGVQEARQRKIEASSRQLGPECAILNRYSTTLSGAPRRISARPMH